jgi:hypothetical protein
MWKMRKTVLLALAITCASVAAFAQTTQTAPSLTGGVPNPIQGVPNPISPEVETRTQQNTTVPFGNAAPTPQDLTRDSTATQPPFTPFGAVTQQTAPSLTGGVPNPIQGVPNPIQGVPNPISPSEETELPNLTPLGAQHCKTPLEYRTLWEGNEASSGARTTQKLADDVYRCESDIDILGRELARQCEIAEAL